MVFSSMTFLWVFFPLVLALYYSCSFIKNKNIQYSFKNSILLIASLIFYAWGGIKYLFLMLTSILGNYLFALLI
ncbi:MAG: MBOAT family protein, partial [Clostridia bacterium]|nr:MBOAT family protein [Clostridia bacterium]